MTSKSDAPPSYAQATGPSTASSRLEVPGAHNGIPAAARRSMEDEHRPLPAGWVRQWDNKEQHQFFVDERANPPRSIWCHPYDDKEYLKTLSSEERERIQEQEKERLIRVKYDTTDDEGALPSKSQPKPSIASGASYTGSSASAAGVSGSSDNKGSQEKSGFGRRLKDKVTGSTHEQRQAERAQREREEAQYYEAHMKFRTALQRAQMTGQPQFLGKDRDGKDVYVEPPRNMYGGGGYGANAYGYNPYSSGPYNDPNVRFIRPSAPYGRPYGGGFGGGMGMPIAGGMLGGMMLGGLLF